MPIFSRRIIQNHGSLQVTIPKPIVEKLALKKGDLLEIEYNPDGSFTCRKSNDLMG